MRVKVSIVLALVAQRELRLGQAPRWRRVYTRPPSRGRQVRPESKSRCLDLWWERGIEARPEPDANLGPVRAVPCTHDDEVAAVGAVELGSIRRGLRHRDAAALVVVHVRVAVERGCVPASA